MMSIHEVCSVLSRYNCRCPPLSQSNTRLCIPRKSGWQFSQHIVHPFHPSKMPWHTPVCADKQNSAQAPQLKSSLLLAEVAGQTIRCHVFKPQRPNSNSTDDNTTPQGPGEQVDSSRSSNGASRDSQPGNNGAAVMLLSDIFGCDTTDNLKMSQRLANELQCPVYMPDLFRGEPWPEQTPVTAKEFEDWRSNIGETWPVSVSSAVATCMAAAGTPRIALLGFCYGGGRVVDALGNARTDLLETCGAPPATYVDVEASLSIDDGDLAAVADAPPPRWSYAAGVAFYGTRIDLAALARVRHPLMLNFAGDDALVPAEAIEDMRGVRARRRSAGPAATAAVGDTTTGDPVQINVEAGALHGFVHQAGKQGEAGDRVLGRAVLFLRKHLLQDGVVNM